MFNYINIIKFFCCLVFISLLSLVLIPEGFTTDLSGCGTSIQNDYKADYDPDNFTSYNILFDETSKKIKLDTGASVINPNSIIIPFEQEVAATFIAEIAGFTKTDFGWMYYDKKTSSWSSKSELYTNVNDNNNNGVLDDAEVDSNGDGTINALDNRKVLGIASAGTELAFYLKVDDQSKTYYTKTAWNEDTYTSTSVSSANEFTKTYLLGLAQSTSGGWLEPSSITRLKDIFQVEIQPTDTYSMTIKRDEKFPHVIVGSPANDPDQWILGWEDYNGGGDTDHNDLVFKINRQSGGSILLKSEIEGNLKPLKPTDSGAYFTSAVIEVYDNMPCNGETSIKYYVSINGGINWVEVFNWDSIKEITVDGSGNISEGNTVTNWSYGNPVYTHRTARIDFSTLGYSGNELLWKSELTSNDDQCVPEILDLKLDGSVALHSNFSRAAPIVKANILYSGNYETPAADWTDKSTLRGHLFAEMIYDPANPSGTKRCYDTDGTTEIDCVPVWDAGVRLNLKSPDERTIYFSDNSVTQIDNEAIGEGDGKTLVFEGTLLKKPIVYSTLRITDDVETFTHKRITTLEGSNSGTGTINTETGQFKVTFTKAPTKKKSIKASYKYYIKANRIETFTTDKVSNAMLALDNTNVIGQGFKYDLDGDKTYNESDGDRLVKWVRGYKKDGTTQKEWLLGAIDHSVPALLTPPPYTPFWYFSDEITDEEKAKYDLFAKEKNDDESTITINEARSTVIFVGSRSGMLHAFDAGKFNWGDNPDTPLPVKEYRGYFAKNNYGTGNELWSFIPTNLLARFKNNFLNLEDQAYVDASPAIADVYTGTAWKSILLSAQGNGGDTVFCLDVTDPLHPTFMWEFSDPDLYRSISSPSVAAIGRVRGEDGLSVWAAFFVSGKTYDNTLDPSIYMVDIATGILTQRIFLNAAGDAGKGGTPSGQPALVDSDDNGFIDRAYIGTDKGYLYKINIPDIKGTTTPQTITHCVLNDPTNAKYFKPIYGTPALINKTTPHVGTDGKLEYNYDIRIFFGTGDSPYLDENIDNATTEYYFLAYTDNDNKGTCITIEEPSWSLKLDAGERVWASAFASAGQIYFGTSTSETEDPCAGYSSTTNNGKGKIYSLNADSGIKNFSNQVGDIISPPVVADEHLYIKTASSPKVQSYGKGSYNNENTTKKIVGTPASTKSWKVIDNEEQFNSIPLQCP